MNLAVLKLSLLGCAVAAGSGAVAQDAQPLPPGEPPAQVRDQAGSVAKKPAPAVVADKAAPRAMPVGVVDFAKILEAYPKAIEERQQLDALMAQRQTELDQFQKRISEISVLRDNFKEGSSEWLNTDLELQLAVRAIEGKRQIFQQELRDQRERFYVSMLEDMQRAVAMVAKERQVGLVLRVHEDLLDGSVDTKARIFESRVVWFAAEEIDLTPAVIKLLQVPLPDKPTDQTGKSGVDGNGDKNNGE